MDIVFKDEKAAAKRWNSTLWQASQVLWFWKRLETLVLFILVIFVNYVTTSVAASDRVVHLINLGWHVGIAVPLDGTTRELLPVAIYYPSAITLEIGWGEGGLQSHGSGLYGRQAARCDSYS